MQTPAPTMRMLGRANNVHAGSRQVRVWDMETGECKKVLTGHSSHVTGVAWIPGDGDDDDGVMRVAACGALDVTG